MNVHEMSQAELDAMAMESDARQGEAVLQAVYDFLGRFVVYPSSHAQSLILSGLRTRTYGRMGVDAPNCVPLA